MWQLEGRPWKPWEVTLEKPGNASWAHWGIFPCRSCWWRDGKEGQIPRPAPGENQGQEEERARALSARTTVISGQMRNHLKHSFNILIHSFIYSSVPIRLTTEMGAF